MIIDRGYRQCEPEERAKQYRGAAEHRQNEKTSTMMHGPMVRYELAKARQRDAWQEADMDRQAEEVIPAQSDLVK